MGRSRGALFFFNAIKKQSFMNTYAKYCPNVFCAKCTEEHQRGDTITMTTKHGKEHDAIVFNFLVAKDGFFYYSIIRADGFNAQEWAKRKAERIAGYATSAEKRAQDHYTKSNRDRDFLSLYAAQAIKVNLSMPESLEYYADLLQQVKEKHQFLKDNPEARQHTYSLTYAAKNVKEQQRYYEIAVKLWAEK